MAKRTYCAYYTEHFEMGSTTPTCEMFHQYGYCPCEHCDVRFTKEQARQVCEGLIVTNNIASLNDQARRAGEALRKITEKLENAKNIPLRTELQTIPLRAWILIEELSMVTDYDFTMKCWNLIKPESNTYSYSSGIWINRMEAVIALAVTGVLDTSSIISLVENQIEVQAIKLR